VLFTSEILAALAQRDDRPWPEYRSGKPITARQLAALLRPLGIMTNHTVRRGARTEKGYRLDWFDDSFARYLPTLQSVTRSQVADSVAFGDFRSVTRSENVTDKNPQNTNISAGCDRVTDREPVSGDEEAIWTA
jgi:putative DNA primase/helicase